jgi:hypothetical protein
VIASTHLRAPQLGAAAMTLACATGLVGPLLVSGVLQPSFEVAVHVAIYGALTFVFARAWRSLARARRSDAAADVDEAIGDLARALELTGGIAVLMIVTTVLVTIGFGMATLTH